jgi:hypothetical protein
MLPVKTMDDEIRWVESQCTHGVSFYKRCKDCQELTAGARQMMAPLDEDTPGGGVGDARDGHGAAS